MTWDVTEGDCLETLAGVGANTYDSIVSDPPYGLGFMGKGWDHQVPGVPFWAEFLRVAKPGAYMLAFGGTRTWHRMAVAIEDAGWEIRDTVMWMYGSGFPKSHNIGKAIDKAAGAEREQVLATGGLHKNKNLNDDGWVKIGDDAPMMDSNTPATDLARKWEGWGTALKPAWEPIILARKKPDGTVAGNAERWGCGGLNIDGTRVGSEGTTRTSNGVRSNGVAFSASVDGSLSTAGIYGSPSGRWPANLILDPEAGAMLDEQAGDASVHKAGVYATGRPAPWWPGGSNNIGRNGSSTRGVFGYGDTGGPSRFFYCPKASKADRNSGCEGMPEEVSDKLGQRHVTGPNANGDRQEWKPQPRANHHPTVKPHDLMRYLCRLVTPPGGTILDPFTGSGSTGKAAMTEGFSFHGCELDPEYAAIARARIEAAQRERGPFKIDRP